jgi:carbon-monoxide dehydrogenase medium subunit
MYNFEYQKPSALDEAAQMLKAQPESRLLAGGMTLIPTLKLRLNKPPRVVDLSGVPGLGGIKVERSAVTIAAMTTHDTVASSKEVQQNIPALAHLADGIGDPAVRNRGTIGGSIANNDPAADYPAAVLGLGATIKTTTRTIAGDEFFTGMFETALQPGEIITAVSFPIPKRSAYMKFPNPASRYAIVGVFVAQFDKGVRVAVTGAGPVVFRQKEMEQALTKNFAPEAVAAIVQSVEGLNEDIHAGADYRAHLVTVMAKRAVAAALGHP